MELSLTLNGNSLTIDVEPQLTLMEFLRDRQHLKGTKNGCATGHCGACTVIVNGKAVRSCLVKMGKLGEAAKVETIEGLAQGDVLHPLQYTFIEEGAVQCGYCTSGSIMSAKALLDENPNRSETEIKDWLTKQKNLCRCTGYVNMVHAIQKAGEMMARGQATPAFEPEGLEIRSTQMRKDLIEIVRGEKVYAGDIEMPGLLHGKILWSEHPHAEILSVDTSEALKMPGVVTTVTAWDIPGINRAGVIAVNRDQPAIAGREQKARYIGDSIASVFAETEEQAAAALEKIKVEYKVLQPVFSPEEAAMPDAPKVHAKGNLLHHSRIERGNVEDAFAKCAVISEHEYYTPMIEHGFLEPEAGVAYPNTSGGVIMMTGSQSVFDERNQLSEILAIPEDQVRVVQVAQGGSFGGKEDFIYQPHLALGALKSGRPVKIVLTREESLRVHVKRHAANMYIKTGATADGQMIALDFRVVLDTGAYMSLGFDVLENFVVFAGGPYYIPHVKIEGKSWYTNNVLAGAMRGFGVNQIVFGLEQNIDEMARALNIDPLDFRLINCLCAGLPTVSDHVLEDGIPGIRETLEEMRKVVGGIKLPEPSGPNKKVGFGVASAVKNIGYGHDIPESAGTIMELDKEGKLTIKVSHHEYGQGGWAGQVKLAINELGIPVENITVVGPDTDKTIPTGPTTASRQTFLTGNATVAVCRMLKEDLFSKASEHLDVNPEGLAFEGSKIVDRQSGKSMQLAELGEKFNYQYEYTAPRTAAMLPNDVPSQFGRPGFQSRMTHWAYGYTTQAAIVEVDTVTGDVKVLKVFVVADVGKLLNAKIVEGQIQGGVVQGVGYALKEEFIVENGINLTDSLHKCNLPTANDAPEIEYRIVEVPHPFGPQGVKGFAETPSMATAGAIANAVYDAIGIRFYSLPMKKKKVQEAIRAQETA